MLLSREDVDDKDDENEHEADEGQNDHNDVAPANFHSCKIRYFENALYLALGKTFGWKVVIHSGSREESCVLIFSDLIKSIA